MTQLQFPSLTPPYDQALRDAVQFILDHWQPIGIIVSGSIIRGTPDASSDFDIMVLVQEPKRQRLQRWFSGVPAELFINPPHMIERYFDGEQQASRPLTAHMLATGVVVLDADPVVQALIGKAQEMLKNPPQLSDFQLTMTRYHAADQYENALDRAKADPPTCLMLLSGAVRTTLSYYFQARGQFIPREKELIAAVSAQDSDLGAWVADFYSDKTLSEKLKIAEQIVDAVLGVRGFFEWESVPESV